MINYDFHHDQPEIVILIIDLLDFKVFNRNILHKNNHKLYEIYAKYPPCEIRQLTLSY
ncbi:hypothetical protein PTE_04037 [Photorhabdus khanii NC19]|uniref:Uncharacterized protein n=1 Tax=Photorhabdus khanii NC19 TaxID=1004151 RepID=W3V110_9GAMM|nr:hypothetical protein PTE_04037 [Photorhabdus khanii NC19]